MSAIHHRRPFRSTERAGFWRLWLAVCRKEYIKPSDQARHNLYVQALGYFKHQNEFGHKEWDLVFDVLRKRLRGLNPEGAERLGGVAEAGEARRKTYRVERAARGVEQLRQDMAAAVGVDNIAQLMPEAYIIAIARDKFGVFSNWRNLPADKLDQLRLTLIERKRGQERKAKRETAQIKISFKGGTATVSSAPQPDSQPAGAIDDSYYE